jgi:hypothetical protein
MVDRVVSLIPTNQLIWLERLANSVLGEGRIPIAMPI